MATAPQWEHVRPGAPGCARVRPGGAPGCARVRPGAPGYFSTAFEKRSKTNEKYENQWKVNEHMKSIETTHSKRFLLRDVRPWRFLGKVWSMLPTLGRPTPRHPHSALTGPHRPHGVSVTTPSYNMNTFCNKMNITWNHLDQYNFSILLYLYLYVVA